MHLLNVYKCKICFLTTKVVEIQQLFGSNSTEKLSRKQMFRYYHMGNIKWLTAYSFNLKYIPYEEVNLVNIGLNFPLENNMSFKSFLTWNCYYSPFSTIISRPWNCVCVPECRRMQWWKTTYCLCSAYFLYPYHASIKHFS